MPLRIIKQLAEPPIKSAAFKKRFDKSTKRVRKKIQQYIIDPNEENTHDLRTSIRRFDASFRLMPKKIRNNADVKDLRSHYKKLFKINSEVRDMDVIRFEFSQYPKDTVSSYPNFLQRLQEHWNEKLSAAREIALLAYSLGIPKVKKAKIPKKKLFRRYKKVASEFANKIERLFPVVLSDAAKTVDLHQLRKACKKMWYILEAENQNGSKHKRKKNTSELICRLTEIQKDLGNIHDCDIVLTHLERGRGGLHSRKGLNHEGGRRGDYSDLIELEEKREGLYHQFVARYGDEIIKQDIIVSHNKEKMSW